MYGLTIFGRRGTPTCEVGSGAKFEGNSFHHGDLLCVGKFAKNFHYVEISKQIYVQKNYVTKCAKRMHIKKWRGGVTGVARGISCAQNEDLIGGNSRAG